MDKAFDKLFEQYCEERFNKMLNEGKKKVSINNLDTINEYVPEPEMTAHELTSVTSRERSELSKLTKTGRKKREVVITDELKEYIDNNGMKCQRCGVKTKDTDVTYEQIRGKSEGKMRDVKRSKCLKCNCNKFSFGSNLK